MQQVITPVTKPFNSVVTIPSSKSISNRALLLAALADGASTLKGFLFSDDSIAFLSGLQALGVNIEVDQLNLSCKIQGTGGVFPRKSAEIYCHEAGTATRFLIPACAAMIGNYNFSASARMMARPIKPLLTLLKQQGSEFDFSQTDWSMPFMLNAKGLQGGELTVDITESSQFLSGLLMAAPYANQPLLLCSASLAKKPYVKMTMAMMRDFGVEVNTVETKAQHTITIPKACYKACDYVIEPDASTASYFFAMAALTSSEITITGFSRQALQGDVKFLNLLEQMGCKITESDGNIKVQGTSKLKSLGTINMSGYTDTFMTVACLSAFVDAPTTITGLAHTRLQESDRIAAIEAGLNRLQIKTSSTEDSITIHPGTPVGTIVDAYNDHRIAMSLALIGLKVPDVTINGAECVAKTCPNYFSLMQQACR